MSLRIAKAVGLGAVVWIWLWSRNAQWAELWSIVVIWCAPLLTFPIALIGRRALNGVDRSRAEWTTMVVHYATMIVLGVAIFRALRLVAQSPGVRIPIPEPVGLALTIVTGFATFLTVVNLALRGWGAPFAAKLSSRLATDWTYAWTRNPYAFVQPRLALVVRTAVPLALVSSLDGNQRFAGLDLLRKDLQQYGPNEGET